MPASPNDTSPEMLELLAQAASRLVDVRKKRGWSRAQLAAAVEIDSDHLGKLERGKSWPGGGLIVRLCRALEMSADWFLFGMGAPPQEKRVRRPFELVKSDTQRTASVARVTDVPKAVAAYIAIEGANLPPIVIEKLKRFDYQSTGLQDITPEQIRRLASALDLGDTARDD